MVNERGRLAYINGSTEGEGVISYSGTVHGKITRVEKSANAQNSLMRI